MANPAPIPPAGVPFGYMNDLWELPEERVGDDQRATSIRLNPLYCPGTPARIQFDLKNQMTVEVRFKIYTPTAVNINIPNESTVKVSAGKKSVKSMKLNLINSKKMKGGYLEIKSCLFGKSLNEFKILVADACEEFSPGMKTIVLNRNFLPELKWKTTVGRTTQFLDSSVEWQAFVGTLENSIKKRGTVMIANKNVALQTIEESTETATRQLIEQTIGGGSKIEEKKESDKDAELHIMANKIFSQAGLTGYAGGDGTVLSVPWDPTFRYRLTYYAAWIWAKGVMANIATQHIPPNTTEFNQEIKKSKWQHPDMGVDDRVRERLQGHPRKLKVVKSTSPFKGASSSSRRSTRVKKSSVKVQSKPDLKNLNDYGFINQNKPLDSKPDLNNFDNKQRIIDLTNPIESKPDLKNLNNKRIIDLSDPIESKPDLKKLTGLTDATETKPDVKNLKLDNQPGKSIDDPMCLSSDTESEQSDSENDDSNTNELEVEDSKDDPTRIEESNQDESEIDVEITSYHHSVEMELFLADCDIPYEDEQTRYLLRQAGILSWTDLIPSVQMTKSTLTTKGIDRQIASRLMDEAMARYLSD